MVVLGVPQCLAGHGLSTFEVCDSDSGSTIRGLCRGIHASSGADTEKPILVLIHGYPQTDLTYRDVGGAINDQPPHRVVLVGHDRGARICHRLTVDAATEHARTGTDTAFTIVATALMDIVPTAIQWAALADPAEASQTFHWPFLANVKLASAMIHAMGADSFVRQMMERWRGTSETAIARFEADDAMEVYMRPFRQMASVVRSSCADYEAGSTQDVQEQRHDQAEGRRMAAPVLVLHSCGMGERFDVQGEWKAWVEREQLLTVVQTGEGIGHFVAEEDPEATVGAMQRWLEDISLSL
ncbi:alpha/beta hydrolase fold protein [Microsporum canis CBS 113480]|uniref:Alpha/beta hydrolase fold protein n=1 Tax=Arthroderma otae (strain ATCC MYA-4605 / CBS 113480) TaxID=554155 RepID=C5FRZ3_ARTOC|nr:alpha/beta hydrolase fold protein [Microsporum canis CBS 113480]EEQ32646.1 alpha/beta hydrolase fold protein [Microsporum canis CBS 113480]